MAEDYHQEYFAQQPAQGYCLFVVAPKVAKFRKTFRREKKEFHLGLAVIRDVRQLMLRRYYPRGHSRGKSCNDVLKVTLGQSVPH